MLQYFNNEFKDLDLNDKRLNNRAITIGNTLLHSPGSCIQEVFSSKEDARCAYDFFSNPKVDWHSLFLCHQQKTINRIQKDKSDYIYVIQDSCYFNYSKHVAKTDIGTLGKQGSHKQFGILQHSSLCLSSTQVPLGLLSVDFMGYDDPLADFSYRDIGAPDNMANRWRYFASETDKAFKHIDKEPIILCDREADTFDILEELTSSTCKYVVRGKWNRITGKSFRKNENLHQEKLYDILSASESLGTARITITNPSTKEEVLHDFVIKGVENIDIPPSRQTLKHGRESKAPIIINAVEAKSDECSWLLLTNLPVTTYEQAVFVIKSYKARWHIESFHKVLKTAYKAEEIYLHSSRAAVENLLTMINIAAFQTYYLILNARECPDEKAISYFTSNQIKAVFVYHNKNKDINMNTKTFTLSDMYYAVAKLGGYKNLTNKKPPGILTIYRGIKKLDEITKVYQVMS